MIIYTDGSNYFTERGVSGGGGGGGNATQIQSVNVAATAPLDRQQLTYVAANSDWEPAFDLQVMRRRASIVADGSTSTLITFGDIATTSFGVGGSGPSTGNTIQGPQIGAGGWSSGTAGGWNGNLNYMNGKNIHFSFMGNLNSKLNTRVWFGLTDQTLATQGGSDNPAGNYAAFRYSTIAGDTHYQCITKDGTTQTIVDSGITPLENTAATFGVLFNDSVPNVKFYINRVLVGTSTTHLPTLTFPLTQAVANTAQTITLTSVAASSSSVAVYTGTVTGGGSNAFAGFIFIVTGFTDAIHNGTFFCTASSATTITLSNNSARGETHAATASSSVSNLGFIGTTAQGVANALNTLVLTTTGFVNGANNTAVTVTASAANGYGGVATGVNETHAGTATAPKGVQMRYVIVETPNGNLSNGINFDQMYAEQDLAI
jgi:hypothetical protein